MNMTKRITGIACGQPQLQSAKDEYVDTNTFTQYRLLMGGYQPTTPTVEQLPSGAYTIMSSEQGLILMPQNILTDELIAFPDSESDMLIREFQFFWEKEAEYRKHGFSHKRGFLLYGPQGSGKTSTINTITKWLISEGGVVLICNNPEWTNLLLAMVRQVEPLRPLLVIIEDIDALISEFQEQDILQLLDGNRSIDHVVFIATTNHPEVLEDRIVNRPSRFDKVVKMKLPNDECRELYIVNKLRDLTKEEVAVWVDATKGLSLAHIKELIISKYCFGNDFDAEVQRLRNMSRKPKSNGDSTAPGFSIPLKEIL